MNIDIKNHNVNKFEPSYGIFPYIILKVGHAIYMQIPIHFIENEYNNTDIISGTYIDKVSKELLLSSRKKLIQHMHTRLIDLTKWVLSKLKTDGYENIRLCLVEGQTKAYYFEQHTVQSSTSIPSGGTLITQTNKVLAMGLPHFIEHQINQEL